LCVSWQNLHKYYGKKSETLWWLTRNVKDDLDCVDQIP